jgi:hypothetical protein
MIVTANMQATSVKSITALSATPQLVTGVAATFHGGVYSNTNTAPTFIQVFSASAASDIALGTTAPAMAIMVPANGTAAAGATLLQDSVRGIAFAKGIVVSATTTASGATGPTAVIATAFYFR